ncbi:MAG: hypothetical protein ACFFDS_02720 [Candidatus Thorarchaeota archaeon]
MNILISVAPTDIAWKVNIGLVVMTGVLAVITFFYMLFTRKMANRMKEQTELFEKEFTIRITPRLDNPTLFPKKRSGSKVWIIPSVFNAGLSAFYLEHVFLKFHHRDYPDISHDDLIPINRYVLPGREYRPDESVEFDYASFPEFADVREIKGKAFIEFFFKYSDLEGNELRWPENSYETREIIN